MAKPDQQPAEQQKTEQPKAGLLTSLAQAAMVATGKLVGDIARDVVAEVPKQIEQGAHEAAAVLFRGDAFVMYPRTSQGNDQELSGGMTLEQLRGYAAEKAKAAEHAMEHQNDRQLGREM